MKIHTIAIIMTTAILSGNSASILEGAGEGRFRLGTVAGRHMLIDPQGQPFFTLGINHINAVQEAANPDIFAEKYQSDWHRYSQAAARDLKSWHYNTAGRLTGGDLLLMPYMKIPSSTEFKFFTR